MFWDPNGSGPIYIIGKGVLPQSMQERFSLLLHVVLFLSDADEEGRHKAARTVKYAMLIT